MSADDAAAMVNASLVASAQLGLFWMASEKPGTACAAPVAVPLPLQILVSPPEGPCAQASLVPSGERAGAVSFVPVVLVSRVSAPPVRDTEYSSALPSR